MKIYFTGKLKLKKKIIGRVNELELNKFLGKSYFVLKR